MARLPYNKLLTNLASSSRTGEYWPSVVFVRTSLRSVRTATTSGQYSPRARLVRGYYYSLLLFTTLYYSLLLFTTLYYSLLLFTTLYYSLLLFTTLYYSLLLFTTLYYSLLLFTTLYYSLLLFTTLYYSLLLFTTLYYSLLLFTTLKSKFPQESNKIKFLRQGLKTQFRSPFAYS